MDRAHSHDATALDHTTYIDNTEAELSAIVTLVEVGPSDSRVPACPGFDLDGLARHVGQVCGFWVQMLCEARGGAPPESAAEDDPAGRARWLAARAEQMVAELRRTSAGSPCWTWDDDDRSAGFVARRVCHEMSVHRVDAESAVGRATPISAAVAADGVEELLDLVRVRPKGGDADGERVGATVHLHATDLDGGGPGASSGEWLLTLGPGTIDVTREHAKGDVAVRAPVSDLMLLLYSRPTGQPAEVFGDESVLAVLQSRLSR